MEIEPLAVNISIHAPRAGRGQGHCLKNQFPLLFQSTRPVRGAARGRVSAFPFVVFQSTRPVRGAALPNTVLLFQVLQISIHAPRAGRGVPEIPVASVPILYFNPRAPCGARRKPFPQSACYFYFNPRAPCGARHDRRSCCLSGLYFNPRAPCGARRLDF